MLSNLKNSILLIVGILAVVFLGLWQIERRNSQRSEQDNRNLILEIKNDLHRYQAKNGNEVVQSAIREYSNQVFRQVLDSSLMAYKDYGITPRRVQELIQAGFRINKQFTTAGKDSVVYMIHKRDSVTYDTIPVLTQTFTIYKDKHNLFESVLYNDSLKTNVQVNVPLAIVIEEGRRKPRLFFWKRKSADSVSVFTENNLVNISDIRLIRKKK